MSVRYEFINHPCPTDLLGEQDLRQIDDSPDPGKFALMLGDPGATALVVVGSPVELSTWATRLARSLSKPAAASPAVTYNVDELRRWFTEEVPSSEEDRFAGTKAEEYGLDAGFPDSDGDLLGVLDAVLAELGERLHPDVWRLGEGVDRMSVWRTADGDGITAGGLITVDLDNDVRLCSLHQDHRDFADRDLRGVAAAVEAMRRVANEVNRLVATYRAGGPGELALREVRRLREELDALGDIAYRATDPESWQDALAAIHRRAKQAVR